MPTIPDIHAPIPSLHNKMTHIPAHLLTTVSLLNRAFPNGITKGDYFSTLKILYEHMSDRNLADGMSLATGKDARVVYNDVLRISAKESGTQGIHMVIDSRMTAGLQAWIDEE